MDWGHAPILCTRSIRHHLDAWQSALTDQAQAERPDLRREGEDWLKTGDWKVHLRVCRDLWARRLL